MDPRYDHTKYEKEIYEKWEESGAFTPKIEKKKKPFSIIMPPPNANDPLHIGHARFVALQDILIRYHRMRGESTLWLPGADHAGIETQFVFEKSLAKEGKSRFDFDRETLFKMTWDYVQKNMKVMKNQLKILGASCDWTRFKFTLDPEIETIVFKTFKKLYDEGLIYRGERIVNYCPRCGTAYSQLEVDYVEKDDNLYYLDYGNIVIATVRPETIFADVAVAVNPKDKKYKELIGKTARIPLINREVPIIADNLVDIKTGSGALKITPGHDATDFEIGKKHALATISVIDESGRMTSCPPKYIGMKVLAAREEIVRDLEKAGKIKKTEKIHHVVGTCYKDKGLIEPRISKQWFLKVEGLAKQALSVIKTKEVNIIAKKYEKIAVHWLKNLRDWNISRQIVWGMRIPAWRCDKCTNWVVTDGESPEKCTSCGHTALTQDPDTFDTWFSSGQWPYATLQTTQKGDFAYFYPTSVMNTAYEILPFWVIRMIMLGIYETGKVPFNDVFFYGLVRDKGGQKISKSKGNVIDPIEMVAKYGSDSLRMGIIWGAMPETDITLDEEKIRGQRNFANKVWNVARFILLDGEKRREINIGKRAPATSNDEDKIILKKLRGAIKMITRSLDKYRLDEAANALYEFIWKDFANDYLEKTKARRMEAQPVLEYVLGRVLIIAHPFLPFVTEKIWELKGEKELLITAAWPKA
ncbi:valine--tRNA ligase [Patescibacteria group bacterium]|nr:valine--tRNA ligase [Patescibacteria group bacterium]